MNETSQDKARSRALNQQFVTRLRDHLDMALYPVQYIDAGRWLLRAGQALTELPLIEAGRLDVVLPLDESGNQVIPVTFVTGELALLSTLFSRQPRHAHLLAADPLQLRWLPLNVIEAVLLEDQDLLVLLVRFFAQRLQEVRARERGWLERSVHRRVCATLARVALEHLPEPGHSWLIGATHERLALRCGVSRPKLSQELKQLEKAGTIKLHRGAIEVQDYPGLVSES